MRILGIDPGLRSLGWGVIDVGGNRFSYVGSGAIRSTGQALSDRLASLFTGLQHVIDCHAPAQVAVEQTFVNTNAASTLLLGQARGVALLVPALAGLPTGEYAPNKVKKTVVGVGHADKMQVAHMVQLQLPGCGHNGHDAIDALAIAICHAVHVGAPGADRNPSDSAARAAS